MRGIDFVATTQTAEVTVRRTSGRECWVARDPAGELVGTFTVSPPGVMTGCAWYDRPDVAVVSMIGVAPELRGTGLGARLLAKAEDVARDLGAAELALDTAVPAEDLRAWYDRRGYRYVDDVDWPMTSFVSVVLSKAL